MHAEGPSAPRSLVWRTDLQVLPAGRVIERRERYLVVRSPENPLHHWGNFLLFDEPPGAGDGARWERLFQQEFSDMPGVVHRAFGWDRSDGVLGEARTEFGARGYELDRVIGLRAGAGDVRAHPRENREVTVAPLDPRPGAEPELWEQVLELWVASSEPTPGEEPGRRSFARGRIGELRALFVAGMGSWYVALDAERREVVGCCGIVASGSRGRFQSVGHARGPASSRGLLTAARRRLPAQRTPPRRRQLRDRRGCRLPRHRAV